MILTCPECSTRYMVPDHAIGTDGRTVRCAKCGHQWYEQAKPAKPATEEAAQTPEAGASQTQPQAQPPATKGKSKPPVRVEKPTPRKAGIGVKLTFAAALLSFLMVGFALYRPAVTGAVPFVQSLYNLVGLYDTTGLTVTDPVLEPFESEGKQGFVIRGTLANVSDEPKRIPALRLSAHAEDGRVIRAFQYNSGDKVINPGETIPFAQHLAVSEIPAYITLDIGNRFEISLRN